MIHDEVINFIRKRFPSDSNWCDGNCYWFAVILSHRFPQYKIWLFPIENHFMAGDGKCFYDWKGKRTAEECEEKPILWSDAADIDSLYAQRITRDCIK